MTGFVTCPVHDRFLDGAKSDRLRCPVDGCEHTQPKPLRQHGAEPEPVDLEPEPTEPSVARIPESPWRDRDTCEHGTPLTIPSSGERLVCHDCTPTVEVGPAPDPDDAARWRELREGLAS